MDSAAEAHGNLGAGRDHGARGGDLLAGQAAAEWLNAEADTACLFNYGSEASAVEIRDGYAVA